MVDGDFNRRNWQLPLTNLIVEQWIWVFDTFICFLCGKFSFKFQDLGELFR